MNPRQWTRRKSIRSIGRRVRAICFAARPHPNLRFGEQTAAIAAEVFAPGSIFAMRGGWPGGRGTASRQKHREIKLKIACGRR